MSAPDQAIRELVERLSERTGLDALEVLGLMADRMQALLDAASEDINQVAQLTAGLHEIHEEIDRRIAEG